MPKPFLCGLCENFYGKYENIFETAICKNCNFQICSNCEFNAFPVAEKKLYQEIINTFLDEKKQYNFIIKMDEEDSKNASSIY